MHENTAPSLRRYVRANSYVATGHFLVVRYETSKGANSTTVGTWRVFEVSSSLAGRDFFRNHGRSALRTKAGVTVLEYSGGACWVRHLYLWVQEIIMQSANIRKECLWSK